MSSVVAQMPAVPRQLGSPPERTGGGICTEEIHLALTATPTYCAHLGRGSTHDHQVHLSFTGWSAQEQGVWKGKMPPPTPDPLPPPPRRTAPRLRLRWATPRRWKSLPRLFSVILPRALSDADRFFADSPPPPPPRHGRPAFTDCRGQP
jgi:hypothetical protein